MYLTYNSAYKRLKNNDPKLTSLGIGVYVYSATELNNILAALKNNRSCRNLSIYHIGDKIHEDAGHYLSEIIKYNVTLVNLTVELPCFFQDQNFIEFIDALKNNTTLQKLSLISQPFNSEHIEHFSESLLKNTSIKYLELQDTNINDKGAVKFASALYKHKKLQHLNLSSNPIGDVGFVALVDSITEKHLLNTLYFHHCDIGDEGVKGLAKALLRSKKLWNISLFHNNIHDEGIINLADAIKSVSYIKELELRKNPFTKYGAEALAAALDASKSLLKSFNPQVFFGVQIFPPDSKKHLAMYKTFYKLP